MIFDSFVLPGLGIDNENTTPLKAFLVPGIRIINDASFGEQIGYLLEYSEKNKDDKSGFKEYPKAVTQLFYKF